MNNKDFTIIAEWCGETNQKEKDVEKLISSLSNRQKNFKRDRFLKIYMNVKQVANA